MARGSRRYGHLRRRLNELRRHLLAFLPPPPQSKISFTPQELDLTRSFVVLAHAEIEAFCEDLALAKARTSQQAFASRGQVTPVLRRIVSYYVAKKGMSWSGVLTPSPKTVEQALNSYLQAVRDNNGIKRKNLERLLYPLGVLEPMLDTTWLAQMDSFGTKRGGLAHQTIGAVSPPDPVSESANVSQLLTGLLDLDRALSRIQ